MVRVLAVILAGSLALVAGCNGSPDSGSAVAPFKSPEATTSDQSLRPVPRESTTEPVLPNIAVDDGSAAFAQLLTAARENQPDSWTQAEQALQKVGSAAVPTYVAALRGDDPMAREMAVMMLVQLGPPSEEAAVGLVAVLADSSAFVRVNAAAALSTLETPPPEAIETLTTLMGDDDETIRVAAASSLGNAGPAAENALGDLARGLSDPAAAVRTATAASLGRIGEASTRYLPALKRLADDEDESVRAAVALAIKQLDPSTRNAAETTVPASATDSAP
ncbi:MAG: HEAT repeat domain-containing protein [Planctomycetaceae bacterium]|nr:HEAT repeat domain-containing protein [Planctomycetaceae bacterium]